MLIEAGKYDIEKLRNDVTLNIATAYLQLLFTYEILDATKSQAHATDVQVGQTQKIVNAGKLPESNLFTIRSQLATDNLAVVNAQGQMDLAKVNLMQLMEIPVIDSFEVVKPVDLEPSAQMLLSNSEIYSKALSIKPEIASASIKTNSALLEIKINESARMPKLTLSGDVNTDYSVANRLSVNSSLKNPFFTQLWDNLGEGLGLNLAIPIFSNRQIKSNIERAKVNALSAQLTEQNTKNILRKAIEQAYTDMRTAINKYAATKEQTAAAELAYRNMEKKYNVGLSTAIDFLIEQNNYFQAQSNMIQSKYDYIFKTKILDFYQGKPIIF
jgi:outer membrane protein